MGLSNMTNTTLYTLLFSLLLAGAYASDSFLVLKGTERFAFDTIPQNNVADLIAHVNGFSSVHACADRTGYPEIDPFAQPKANILVVIDAVSQDDLASEPRDFFDTTNAVEILKQAYPEDSLSVLTGIMTGEDWESHGIVGSSWKATDYLGVKAFSQRGQCKVPTLLDVLTHASEGTTRSVIFLETKTWVLLWEFTTNFLLKTLTGTVELSFILKKPELLICIHKNLLLPIQLFEKLLRTK